jgi:hypothetical protein
MKHAKAILLAVTAIVSTLTLTACFTSRQQTANAENIPNNPDYNWDVRPILSQNCFACHGQGTQKAGLRLDIQKAAYDSIPEDKTKHAFVPGNPSKSEAFKRITSTDADYRMPPKDSHKTLSAHEIAIIKRWIEQGAHYKQHWAYITPTVVKPERTKWDKQAVNAIDRYIYAKLATEGLSPSAEADKETLINRVYLDLTGLPPSLQEVDAFINDTSPNAYEKIVDHLLSSTEYAERQTNIWMDVARYADSRGGLNDGERGISFPYRDWVINAFKRNMPYDEFVTWQLAGDKLNNGHPTREQLLASAFLKEGRQDSEGGSIDEEFRTNYVQERTELIGKDFLGLTVGCAKCHNHKYDVIAQSDYYSLAGFFNQMDERGQGSGSRGTPGGATIEWPTPLQSKRLEAAHAITVAKEQAYQVALQSAQINKIALDTNRTTFIQSSIQADTQAYYPLDAGYKDSFDELYLDPQPTAPGEPLPNQKNNFPGLTAAQVTAILQNKILADVKVGKPTPSMTPKDDSMSPKTIKSSDIKDPKKAPPRRSRFGGMDGDIAAMKADPNLPRIASHEIDWAMEQLVASGFTDDRLGDPQRIMKRQLPQWIHEDSLLWTDAGIQGEKRGFVSNVKFVSGHKGQGIQLKDSVFAADKSVGMFERTQPYTLDFWLKLPKKPYYDNTRPLGPSASIIYNNGGIEGLGYELTMSNNKMAYSITHQAPTDMLRISTIQDVPTGRWVHITSTYDGNSKAAGMHLYFDGVEQKAQIDHDHLTRSAFPRGGNSQFVSYFGLSAGVNFNRPELVDGAIDELRVITRALTPTEITYLQDPALLKQVPAQQAISDMKLIMAELDPAVQRAWQEMTDARLAEQRIETPIYRVMVAGDQAIPRKNFVLDRGVYNSYLQEVKPQAPNRVFAWNETLPRDRLGLTEWMFDPKNPLVARVYVNRIWQNHFGTGIVQTVDDFGTQGTNPTHSELLDYLAVEFIRSGWDIKHIQKLIVMSATYRQNSNITHDALEKDPRNFLLERGPRFRMPAEVIRDNALAASGLLLKKVGGDAVFPYAPDAIWDGVAQGAVIYPTNEPDDQMHRRSMYTYIKRNSPVANLVPFDMPDRYNAQVLRPVSTTPLQSLVMLNDVQFMEAYRKLSERAIKSSANQDQQLITMFRLAVRRHPNDNELSVLRKYRVAEISRMQNSPDEVKKILSMGVSPTDTSIDPAQLAAMTMVTASVMNTPDAYTLH